MKRILLVPDSFKGTMSSREVCDIMAGEIQTYYPQAQVIAIPVADGGEGSVDAFLSAVGGEKVKVPCQGPYLEEREGFYGRLPDGTAVVEMAAAAGLPLVGERLNAGATSTYGVGQLILAAARQGARRIVVGLGGSATNDGGCGAAAALGVRFLDKQGEEYVPTGDTLDRLASINLSHLDSALEGVQLVTMCDIDNPLCGPSGASAVFGPQKGATPEQVEVLDRNLRHLADVTAATLGEDLRNLPGAGAAGGMGFGMRALLGSAMQMGIETVLDTVDFDYLLEGADLVLTGEGKLDTQSLRGKVVVGVARRCAPKNVPVVAIVGDIGDGVEEIYELGVTAVFSINRVALPFEQARTRSRSDLQKTMENLMRLIQRMEPR